MNVPGGLSSHRIGRALSAMISLLLVGATSAGAQEDAPSPTDIVVANVQIAPRRVRPGGVVRVTMTLRNQGPLIVRSQGPSSRTVYTQGETFTDKGFATVRPNRYSVVMALSGPRGHRWPYRWGLGGDLRLGQIRRVSYPIRLTEPGRYTVFVGIAAGEQIQELSRAGFAGIEVIGAGRSAQATPGIIRRTPPTRITVNGKEVPLDQPPVFYQSQITVSNVQILVPIRFVVEALGANVDWNRSARTASIRRGSYDMLLRAGRDQHVINGKSVTTHVPLPIRGGRTMVPIRFISQSLGGTVNWDNRTRTVEITLPPLDARQ